MAKAEVRAVVYARYSSDNQREESIEAQLRAIKEYCEKNNIQLVKNIY
nr:recombinase family protein [Thermoanaerobacter mathranii]